MAQKTDVKAMMARFQGSGTSVDESSFTPGPKKPLHSTLSSAPAPQWKPSVENSPASPVSAAPKPAFLKNTNRRLSDSQETNKITSLASRFAPALEEDSTSKPPFGHKPLKPPQTQNQNIKRFEPKPPVNKSTISSSLPESKVDPPKPQLSAKPSWVKEEAVSPTAPKIPSQGQKPNSSFRRLRQQGEVQTRLNTETTSKPPTLEKEALKPPGNFKNVQNVPTKMKEEEEQTNKPPLTPAHPPKPPPNKELNVRKELQASAHTNGMDGDTASEPKKKPLTKIWALGPAPAKPTRPPTVNLDTFKRSAGSSSDAPVIKKPPLPPPQPVTQSPPPPPVLPNLPPRHPSSVNQQEELYDDADTLTTSPPPLPPSSGHPSQRGKEGNEDDNESDDDDGELYVDLDERWDAAEQKQDKKNNKSEKEEKKRLEAEKKEQKEREKKENEAKKRFKLFGPLEVIHQARARIDCKGSKNDLSLKQGDQLNIIRVQGNPEGKWLGRTPDGSIGYVKTTSVEIDFNTLKKRQAQPAYEPELYDDIDTFSSDNSGNKWTGAALPPIPPAEEGEIYDDCVDLNVEASPTAKSAPVRPKVLQRMFERNRQPASAKVFPPLSHSPAATNSDTMCGAIDEEIYDDVDPPSAPLPPPPPPINSLPGAKNKSRGDDVDLKKQKKLEKEEKDFKKKFKYEGEIQVLYQVIVSCALTNKKWGHKDLPLKAGEKLDVIVKAEDNKLICRNEDGKFGYVSTSHIDEDDEDIYDDIGDDCIYDND